MGKNFYTVVQTKLAINLQEVTIPGCARIWLYQIYGKMVGINAEIPIGTVRIQTSGR